MSSNFAVVDLRDGTRRDVQSFLLQNDAFPVLENAYLFRGRIEKRSCFSPVGIDGRLKWQIGTTDGSGDATITLANIPITSGISQFTIANDILTDAGGVSPTVLLTTDPTINTRSLNRTTGVLTITGATPSTAIYYIPGLPVMGLRTREQDALNDELLIGFDTRYSYIFDTGTNDFIGANTFKYQSPAVSGPVFTWSGTSADLFWTSNYYGVMWTTNNVSGLNAYAITAGTDAIPSVITVTAGHNIAVNDVVMIANTSTSNTLNGRTFQVSAVAGATITLNNTVAPGGGAFNSGYVVVLNRQVNSNGTAGDGIKWYDGPGSGTGWVNFVAPLNSATPQRLLRGALIVLPYKDRLLCLNTYESTGTNSPVNFKQRARWSQNGTPFFTEDNASTPVEYLLPTNQSAQYDAWFDTVVGKGGFLDAPTQEAIVSAEFIKDTLVVYFERSTWQLVYTNNEVLPFIWQKINTELGCESTFSTVPFDRGVFAVGNYGIITTDSVNVVRIDQKIPDEVFQIQNINNGVKRVSGVRDYNAQLVYWSYPIRSDEDNEVVTYQLTYPNQVLVYNYLDGSWAEFDDSFTCFGYWQKFSDVTWAQLPRSWQSSSFAWNSQVLEARYPDVIAGNQRGFVMAISQLQLNGQNSPSLQINDYTTATRTIICPDHNLVNNQYVLITDAQGLTGINNIIYKVTQASANTFVLDGVNSITGTYTGGGLITHIPNVTIKTKQFNPYYQNGTSLRVQYIDMYMDRTDEGEITAQFYTSDNNSVPVDTQTVITAPEPLPTYQQPSPSSNYQLTQGKIWHRVYTNSFGSFVQNIFTLDDDQMRDLSIATSDLTIHGLIYYISPAGRVSYDI